MRHIIELKNISKSFGEAEVLKNISLKVRENETVLITGPNGSGKTTLLRCLSLLEKINEGEIILDGNIITPETGTESLLKKQLTGFVFQELHLWPHFTVTENITKPLMVVNKISKENATKIAEEILGSVGLADKKNEYPSFLSGGQKRRLLIARTLAMNPKILLLDEITANLDAEIKKEIFSVIKKIAKNKTTIIVSHDKELRNIAERVFYLKDGVLTEKT